MASRFPSAWMEELRARSDLVQVVSGYVPLKKNGRNFWGLCPFHGEKTASFAVDPEHQLYYCFGCKAGGDVVHFIMDIERCDFREAVELLADRAHMTLPEMENDEDYERRRTQRARLLEANRQAARFFHETLFQPAGAASLAYLRRRGLDDQVIRKFGLGAAPESWTALTDLLQSRGFTLQELSLAGLTVVKPPATEGGRERVYDMFRNRPIFPIIDQYKNILGFGGRSLDGSDPKYLNTADTPVFNKRKGVYAANLLRQQRHLDRVILVEGYMDVVSLTQFGVPGVCATLGTALTNEQARLLRRFAPMVYLGYDGDSAGQHAILRGLDIMKEEGIPVGVLDFPDGLDPDEFIRRDGAAGFAALPVLSPAAYRLRRLKAESNLSTQEGRIAYARSAAKVLQDVDPVEREALLKPLTVETGFSREVLLQQIDQAAPAQKDSREAPRPAAPRPPRVSRLAPGAPEDESLAAQERLLSILASGQIPKDIVEEKDFGDDELKSLYRGLLDGVSPGSLVAEAPDEESCSRYTRILLSPPAESKDELMAMASECVARIRKAARKRSYEEIMAAVDTAASEDERMALLTEAQRLLKAMNE